ncbi:MAG TPA: class I SAM-dependent methyltransferase [Spirochaetota bacterium]|nr:class I SAM-dependent methyltransferase [Spirochaetota bacterium]HQF08988.1 class I SAM-dependent methyltransferase [Spirochaetota bacterium]HQH97876.1 class I SAM-dependent methyltransferase [Spirochaetota bacterium]HQJ72569.1 class I SAM-dependent methyltransferase [Spirochaetota bacterium]HRS77230.1 class I SAM-dependent methyltransferase [Spirochaetota bacterium]
MDENKNKSRWYDGLFYSITIDPIAGKSFAKPISRYVSENSSIIDVGCGTGSVVLELAKRCYHVTGIELSPKMVNFARKRLDAASINNAEILQMSATELSSKVSRTFDYAVMTQFLHEIPAEIRDKVMGEVKKVAREFIIADFIAPYPSTLQGMMIRFVEMSAGKEHNANFGDWLGKGGLDGFLNRHGLMVIEERTFLTGVGKIVKAKVR